MRKLILLVTILILLASLVCAENPPVNPVLWWEAEDLTTQFGDFNFAKTGNPTFTPGVFNNALTGCDNSNYLDNSTAWTLPVAPNEHTVCIWIYPDTLVSHSYFEIGGDGGYLVMYSFAEGASMKWRWHTVGDEDATLTTSLSSDWWHFCHVSNGTDYIVYVNSTPTVIGAGTKTIFDDITIEHVSIGRPTEYGGNADVANKFDDLIVFDYALTQEQVSSIMNESYFPAPPTNSSWEVYSNHTVSGERNDSWNTGGEINITDNLITFIVTTNKAANGTCALDQDLNYTAMINLNSNYGFATDASPPTATDLAYTVYDDISVGPHCLYCSFIEVYGNEYANSSSGCLPVRRYTYPNVTLQYPLNASTFNTSKYIMVDHNVSVYLYNASRTDNITNCTVSTNSTGIWKINHTLTHIANDTEINVTLNLSIGSYLWGSTCCNEKNMCNTTKNSTYSIGPIVAKGSLLLDGLNTSRKYEFGTTVNLTIESNCSNCEFCFYIYDNTSRYLNYGCGAGNHSINYTIDILRTIIFNDSTTSKTFNDGKKYYVYIDNRTYLDKILFNISGLAENVSINFTEGFITIPERVNSNGEQEIINFIYAGNSYPIVNITFRSAEIKIIYLNESTFGNLSIAGLLNFTMTAFNLDSGNAFNFTDNFDNKSLFSGNYSENISLYSATNDFEDNKTTWWTGTDTEYDYLIVRGTTEKYLQAFDFGIGEAGIAAEWNNLGSFDMGQAYQFQTVLVSGNAYSCPNGNSVTLDRYIYLSDGTTDVTLWSHTTSVGCAGGASGSRTDYLNISGIKDENNNLKVYLAGVYSKTVSLSSLAPDSRYYLKFKSRGKSTAGGASGSMYFNLFSINQSGISLKMNNSNYSLVSTNYTSEILNETLNTIIRLRLNATVYDDDDTTINYYLSNDNGTTWEEAVNGAVHSFESIGNISRVRFTLATTKVNISPIIYSYSTEVIPSALTGLNIKLGNSPTYDMDLDYELNDTTTPLYYNATDNYLRDYINTTPACNVSNNNITCLIPIQFISDSGGVLEISNMNYTRNINPISLNYWINDLESYDDIPFNLTMDSGTITMNDLKFDFFGSKNITVMVKYINNVIAYWNILVKYSPFDVSIIPQSIDYWDIGPNLHSWIQTYVPPFGNADGDGNPFFNITGENQMNIYLKYNESVNSCATTWFEGMNGTTGILVNITLNDSNQLFINNLSSAINVNISTWTNISCAAENSTLIIPYFCFTSLCPDCVKTQDFNSNCDWII